MVSVYERLIMKWWVCFGLILLFVRLTHTKPVKQKRFTSGGELVREKRHEVEEEGKATNEMQTFMLDLSTKEDMRRLHERFKKVDAKRDIEDDQEYRRLRRFSVPGEENDSTDTMEERSSRTAREDHDKTSVESSPPSNHSRPWQYFMRHKRDFSLLTKLFSKRNSNKDEAHEDKSNRQQTQHLDDNDMQELSADKESPADESNRQQTQHLDENDMQELPTDEKSPADEESPADESNRQQTQHLDDNDMQELPTDEKSPADDESPADESNRQQTQKSDDNDMRELSTDKSNRQQTQKSDENEDELLPEEEPVSNEQENSDIFETNSLEEYQKDFESEPDGIEDTAGANEGELAGAPRVNYHLVGDTWEIIHHDPHARSLRGLVNSNTTMHSERDGAVLDANVTVHMHRRALVDVSDDVTHDMTRDVRNDITHDLNDDVIRDVTRDVSDDVTRDVSGDATHDGSSDVTHDAPYQVPYEVKRDISDDVTNGMSNGVTDDMGDDVTRDVIGSVTGDVNQYSISEAPRRVPRVSNVRVVRSDEPGYEVQEISAVYSSKVDDDPDDDSAHVIAVKKKAIQSDGYIGCFMDQHPNRDLIKAFSIDNLTPQACRSACRSAGHAYSGVQYGYLCHCGDDYGKYGHAPERECNSYCAGNQKMACGGFWRNSVYATDLFGESEDNEITTRSQIDRIIPLPVSEDDEVPVNQYITAYLRANVPQVSGKDTAITQTTNLRQPISDMSARTDKVISKKTEIASPPLQRPNNEGKINQHAYLHPQHVEPRSFIPSSVVLKPLLPIPGRKKYVGTVKLKQNWQDDLKNRNSPKTMILAGNIESALSQMFDMDKDFLKADVLGFREATIRRKPNNIHKVLVQFALTFKKSATGKDKKLRKMVENSNKLDEMPVFGYTVHVKEYHSNQKDSAEQESKENTPHDTRKARENKEENDPFLEKVFSQI